MSYGGSITTSKIQSRDGTTIWSARQHHDWHRDDFPAGYYSPGIKPSIEGGKTLILTHTNNTRPNVATAQLEDDRLIEVSKNGDIVREWLASDHIDELGFSDAARTAIKAAPSSTVLGAVLIGCTSTPQRMSGRITGSTKEISDSLLATSSAAAGRRAF